MVMYPREFGTEPYKQYFLFQENTKQFEKDICVKKKMTYNFALMSVFIYTVFAKMLKGTALKSCH